MADLAHLLPPLAPEQLYQSQRATIIASSVVATTLATIAVSLRFWARWLYSKGIGADDYLAAAVVPLAWAMTGTFIFATNNGLGEHLLAVVNTNSTELVSEGQAYFASELGWAIITPMVKISVVLLYVRIFSSKMYLRIAAWGVGSTTVAWSLAVFLVGCLQCRPLAGVWDISVSATCIDTWAFFVAASVFNLAIDLFVLMLPIPAACELLFGYPRRIALIGVFLIGALTCASSILRFVTLVQSQYNLDATWVQGSAAVWSIIEPCLGIIAASLVTLWPLTSRRRDEFDTVELGRRRGFSFREIRDDKRSLGTTSRAASREGHHMVEEGIIQIETTLEMRHSVSH